MALVWSQRELILSSRAMVIHHQLNNTVRGREYDKRHGKRGVREREREILYSFCQKESKMFANVL